MSEAKSPVARERLYEILAGTFVLGAFGLGALLIFLLGQKQQVFQEQAVLHAEFSEVQGLSEGAPVRLAGVKIGSVARVEFSPDRQRRTIRVDLEVAKKLLDQLGGDPVARIDSQGLLGDKIIEIAPGVSTKPPPTAGSTIRTLEPTDLNKLLADARLVMVKAQRVADGAARIMDEVNEPSLATDLRSSVASVRKLLEATQKGSGLAHALFYDPSTSAQMNKILAEAANLTTEVNAAVKSINAVLNSTDGDGRQLINNVSRATKNVAAVAADLHDSQIIPQVDKAAKDVAALTAYARSGQGSLGALLVDPTAYERLVTILGGVERSRILRAVVRYAIAKDDGATAARVVTDPPTTSSLPEPGKK